MSPENLREIDKSWSEFQEKRPAWLKDKFGQLSDRDIYRCIKEKIIKIEPCVDELAEIITNSNRVDLHLGNLITSFKTTRITQVRFGEPIPKELQEDNHVRDNETFVLHPGHYVLAPTREKLTLPNFITGRMDGRSSGARIGLNVQQAAIFDAGWDGYPMMELANNGNVAIVLQPGDKVCAFTFELLTTAARNAHGGRYHNQTSPEIR